MIESENILDNRNSFDSNKNNIFAQRLRRQIHSIYRRHKRENDNNDSSNGAGNDGSSNYDQSNSSNNDVQSPYESQGDYSAINSGDNNYQS